MHERTPIPKYHGWYGRCPGVHKCAHPKNTNNVGRFPYKSINGRKNDKNMPDVRNIQGRRQIETNSETMGIRIYRTACM